MLQIGVLYARLKYVSSVHRRRDAMCVTYLRYRDSPEVAPFLPGCTFALYRRSPLYAATVKSRNKGEYAGGVRVSRSVSRVSSCRARDRGVAFSRPTSHAQCIFAVVVPHRQLKLTLFKSFPCKMASQQKDVYLVIGGSGFVGRHIVQQLLERGDSVSVFDIVQRYHDTPFYSGDISEEGSISQALQQVR